MKALNEGLQMRSDWTLPLCTGKERIKVNGAKAHSTQKPEALLYRVLLSTTNPGDVVLDPFFGTGTTGAVARRLGRSWIGIERDPDYVQIARARIAEITPTSADEPALRLENPRREKRLPFGALLESGLLNPGQTLYFKAQAEQSAVLMADGQLEYNGVRGSIHQIARLIQAEAGNGWQVWYFRSAANGKYTCIDSLRRHLRTIRKSTFKESEL